MSTVYHLYRYCVFCFGKANAIINIPVARFDTHVLASTSIFLLKAHEQTESSIILAGVCVAVGGGGWLAGKPCARPGPEFTEPAREGECEAAAAMQRRRETLQIFARRGGGHDGELVT